ncbi:MULTISPECIES: DUF72 domain-containing protein [unclassified Chelatococcus]|uniref:DUF72 domain-containing protein n=1 Tax=unclassified Chelatococcus TaxID=2638111 RepID=UPI001BCE0DB0|nr:MULTISPECIES: DUF72 domain-containing protein [unclassified Chelatococcus]MBS7699013.1 DUF72 domain-containing protein [Chelatococcus sp. YT9]MBX3558946.1 DUF72 domain-containing protein [Chelatococcus sp.]
MSRRHGVVRIGVSGWTYAGWRGHFYPEGTVQKRELAYAATRFPALEINGTFYGLQKPPIFARWAKETPDGFIFAVKGSRYITHSKRLRDVESALANFLASGVLRLGPKLGPLLWQLPPNLRFDPGLIRDFLALLPKDTDAASALARHHDSRVDGRADTETDARRPLRHALEIRHESFRDPALIDLLREAGVALVCADTVDWPRLMDLPADFAYCRLHGSDELYRSRYSDAALGTWAARVAAWAAGRTMKDGDFIGSVERHPTPRDVFVFFDNTDKRHAPEDALRLMQRLGVEWHAEDKKAA